MKNRQLAEMIKRLRAKKLDEIIGKPPEFEPKHGKGSHGEDPNSPNQYVHRMKEEKLDETLGGTYHRRKLSIFTKSKKPSERTWQKQGQQSMQNGKRYTAEENKKEVELGTTDTKQSGETISVNPKDNTASAKGGEMNNNKNTTIKEIKEK